MIENSQGSIPPFAPAAPIGSDKIAVYALQDVFREVTRKDKEPEMVLVHAAGHRQELEASIAREVVRNSPKDYGFLPPGGVVAPAESSAPSTNERIADILNDPAALAVLRAALLGAQFQPAVGQVSDAAAPGGVAQATPASTQQVNTGADAFQLTNLPGVNDKLARSLEDHGFGTLVALQGATVETLSAVPGMGEKIAKNIVAHVAEKYPAKKEG